MEISPTAAKDFKETKLFLKF